MASKYGNERLANVMADSILDFVNSTIDHQLDNLDLSDKIDSAIDELDLESKIESAVSDFDFSSVIDNDLVLQNIDIESLFQDWLNKKFEKQIEPALDSIREDIETNGRHFSEQAKLISAISDTIEGHKADILSNAKLISELLCRTTELFRMQDRLDYLERDFNRILADKLRGRPTVLERAWGRIKGLFARKGA
jgi:hypothetical protein